MQYTEVKWVRNNLESINADIGGLVSFVMAILAVSLSFYESHNYENQLVSKLYTREDLDNPNRFDSVLDDEIPKTPTEEDK